MNVREFSKLLLGAALIPGAVAGMMCAAHARAEPWGIFFQPPASPIASDSQAFADLTFWIIGAICLLVLALLIAVVVRFNARSNPTPSKTAHNTLIEVVWTVLPVLILIIIAIPSFRLLYKQQTVPEAALTVKAIGNKWFWSYEYPDNDGLSFSSYMLEDNAITDPVNQPRLLAVDYPLVVPVGKVVRLYVTAQDVLHSFALPSMFVKVDAIPGRLNEGWFQVDRPGVYYGQCSELCGQGHAFMPIEVHAVSEAQFAAWLEAAKTDLDAGKALLATFRDENRKLAAAH